MKIHHSIVISRDLGQQAFAGCEIQFKQDGLFETLDITEDDPRWPQVALGLARYQEISEALRGFPIPGASDGDRIWTEFSDTERRRATFLELGAWHHGYPQPEDFKLEAPLRIDKLAYLKETYDLTGACEKCWRGREQIAPFRMKKNPAWGRRSILQLEWVREEFFVKPEVYETVFRPLGIGYRPVLSHKTGSELEAVVQLAVDAVAELKLDGVPFEVCLVCHRKDYHRSCRGYPPSPVPTNAALFKSEQTFNGFDRRVYVSNSLYREMLRAKVRGAEFDPCETRRRV